MVRIVLIFKDYYILKLLYISYYSLKKWTDYKLRWNESDYGGITDIRLPFDKIWKPVNIN